MHSDLITGQSIPCHMAVAPYPDYILNQGTSEQILMALSDDPEDQKPLNTQQVCSSDNPADYILNQVTSEQCDAPALGGSTQTTGDLSLEK